MKRLRLVAAIAALSSALMACTANAPAAVRSSATVPAPTAVSAALQPFYSQHLDWQPCRKVLQCAHYDVPVDYANPGGDTLTIQVARAVATGPSLGSLVVNPGGPGGSGIEYIADPQYAVSKEARRRFDLVSFDPRGVGASDALWCLQGAQVDAFLEIDPTPDNAAERKAIVTAGKALAKACQREDATLMAHLSATDVARDMDVLRALLDEPRLRYLGKSWGTELGKVYAALFSQHVGAFVYDGAVDTGVGPIQAAYDQAQGFETAVDRFAAWCARKASCAIGRTAASAKAAIVKFVRGLDAHPLPTDDPKRPLSEAEAITAILGPLYLGVSGWDWLLTGLAPAINLRAGRPLQTIYDWFVERNADGSFANNGNTVIYAMNCLDHPTSVRSIAQAQQLATAWARKLPLMGAAMAWSELPCATWPVHASIDVTKLHVHDVPPSLVIGGTYDPATPLQWAKGLAREVPGAVLVIRNGDGHTSYATSSPCIDGIVDAYLESTDVLKPVLPAKGTVCASTAS